MKTDWFKGMETGPEWEDYRISMANEIAWFSTLDDRYRAEVQRVERYVGELKIFDHNKSDEEIYSRPVHILYDALFGPDVEDVDEWMTIVMNFVDTEYDDATS